MATEFGWYDDVRMSTLLKSRILERSYLSHGKCIDDLNRVVMCWMEITHTNTTIRYMMPSVTRFSSTETTASPS